MQQHSFHLVTPSPWPIFTAFSAFIAAFGMVMEFGYFAGGDLLLQLGLILLLVNMSCWWRDIARESDYQGMHTIRVQRGIKIGFVLFVISEVMFFFSFFWTYFHVSLDPSIWIGCVWPPPGINPPNPFKLPLLNTHLLLTSGLILTQSHWQFKGKHLDFPMYDKFIKKYPVLVPAEISLIITILLGLIFIFVQFYEYKHLPFNINDGIYGSVFYLMTGFHGFHVIVGVIYLTVCLYRMYQKLIFVNHHVSFETAIWYWHFVDIVWLFLYVFVYVWSYV